MHRIDTPGSQNGTFEAGNPIAGVRSTIVGADWPNTIQEELAHLVEAEGFGLSKTNDTQVRQAIQSMIDAGSSPVGWLNVQTDFLARGNGTNDDTAAIQAAIDSATTLGGTVYLPRGTYRTTAVLVLKPNVRLVGDGRPSIIDLDGDHNGVDIQASAVGCRISTLALAGRAAISPVTERGAIRVLGGVQDTLLDGLFFDNVVNCAIVVAGSSTTVNLQIDGIQIDGTGEHGILVKGDPRRLQIERVIFENVGGVASGIGSGVGIKIDEAQNVTIANVYGITDATNGSHAMVIGPDGAADAVRRVLIYGCHLVSATSTVTDAGLLIQGDATNVIVSTSRISGALGIRLDGSSGERPFQIHLNGLSVVSNDATAEYALEVEWAEEVYVQGGHWQSGSATGFAVRVQANATHVFLDGLFLNLTGAAGKGISDVGPSTYSDRIHMRGTGNGGSLLNVVPETQIQSLSLLPQNDTTPSVKHKRIVRTQNTSPTTITDFDDGTTGMEVLLLVNDSDTTLDFTGANLKGNGGVDLAVTDGDSFRMVYDGSNWWVQVS